MAIFSKPRVKSKHRQTSPQPTAEVDEADIERRVTFILTYLDTIEPGSKNKTTCYQMAIDGIKTRLADQELSDEDAQSVLQRAVRHCAENERGKWEKIEFASAQELFMRINHDINEEIIRIEKETQPPRKESVIAQRIEEIKARLERVGAIDEWHKQMRAIEALLDVQPDGLLRHSTAETMIDTAIRKFADTSFEPYAFMEGPKTKWDMTGGSNALSMPSNKYLASLIEDNLNTEIQDAIRRGKKRQGKEHHV